MPRNWRNSIIDSNCVMWWEPQAKKNEARFEASFDRSVVWPCRDGHVGCYASDWRAVVPRPRLVRIPKRHRHKAKSSLLGVSTLAQIRYYDIQL